MRRVLSSRRGRVAVAMAALVLLSPANPPAAADQPSILSDTVARLGAESAAFDRAALFSITVRALDSGEEARFRGDQRFKAASALKPVWLAAALAGHDIDEVAPFAPLVIAASSNDAAGDLIDLAGGLDFINTFTHGLGMSDTYVVEWRFGAIRRSSDYPGPWLARNFTTTDDLVTFWTVLHDFPVLEAAERAAVIEWGRLPRGTGYWAGLTTRLPAYAIPGVSYKMGWLPPGRDFETYVDENGEPTITEALDVLIGSGLVEVPDGPTYAVAVAAFGGDSWNGKVAWISYASCAVYTAVSGDTTECLRNTDPRSVRLAALPQGSLDAVRGSTEFLSVAGTVDSPNPAQRRSVVRFEVDGTVAGYIRPRLNPASSSSARYQTTLLVMLSAGEHEVCASALGFAGEVQLGCRAVAVR